MASYLSIPLKDFELCVRWVILVRPLMASPSWWSNHLVNFFRISLSVGSLALILRELDIIDALLEHWSHTVMVDEHLRLERFVVLESYASLTGDTGVVALDVTASRNQRSV